jgi:hypothetical protein
MKYYLFGGDWYYPRGGVDDLVKISTSVEELKEVAKEKFKDEYEWYHICDDEMNIIERCEKQK